MPGNIAMRKDQRGAVAILMGFILVILVAMLALAIDLGHAYLAKSGLQNGADAAALAGAKELNGTYDGVQAARTVAIEIARQNTYDFSKPVATNAADGGLEITVGSCPDDGSCTMEPVDSITDDALAGDKTFLKVDTGQRYVEPWFARIFQMIEYEGTDHVDTFGMAVAGRYLVEVTPMAVCAVDSTRPEAGFLRGVAYNLPDLNPINNGDPIWINPVDSYPGNCDPNHGNTPTLVPFTCTGHSSTITSIPGDVWVNTGAQSALTGPLNSRFGDNYSGGNACNPMTAPPDVNVKEFFCTRAANPNRDNFCSTSVGANQPQFWMDAANTTPTLPYHQTIETLGSTKQGKPFNYPARTSPETAADFSRYGALWSYSREVRDFSTWPYAEYSTTDWPTLYGGTAENYPASSPYLSWIDPPSGPGALYKRPNRRVLNIAIINCEGVTSIPGQQCRMHLPVVAVGKFFMQRRANLPNNITGEFAGTFGPTLPPSNIRLYR